MAYIACFTLKEENIHFLTQYSVSIFGKALPIVTRCSVLDVTGVLKPLKYVPTWIASVGNLIQNPGKR